MSKTYTVKNNAELDAALKAATGGDRIELVNTGNPYKIIDRNMTDFDSEVVITSADPTDPPRVERIILRDTKNITLEHLDVSATLDEVNARGFDPGKQIYSHDVELVRTTGIIIRNCEFTGNATGIAGLEQDSVSSGLAIIDSKGFIIEGNVISNYHHAFRLGEIEDFSISGNDISKMQGDGIRGGQFINGKINGNYFHDWIGSTYAVNHDDMIQIWSQGTEEPTRDLDISNNVFDAGEGVGTQTILFLNEMVNAGNFDEWAYTNITITNNYIHNGQADGISLNGINGAYVAENTLIEHESQPLTEDGTPGRGGPPRVRVRTENVDNITVVDNNWTRFVQEAGPIDNMSGNGSNGIGASVSPETWQETHDAGIAPGIDFGSINGARFVDTDSDSMFASSVHDFSTDTELGLVVELDPSNPATAAVKSVQFVMGGNIYETDLYQGKAAMFGDSGPGKYDTGKHFDAGAHEVTIKYLGADGLVLNSETVTFDVAESTSAKATTSEPVNALADDGIIVVSNDAELADALANATGGETIVLRDGKYGKIELTDSFDTPVTLRAENPHGAEVTEIRVDGGSGLTVQGLTIPEGVYAINGASHVTVTHSNIGELFYLKNASHITISDNDIDAGKMGLIINSTQHFVVTNNYIHDAVEDLMRVTSNSYDGLIANNIVYDLHTPDPAPGEDRMHPDMLQFFGSAEGTPHDITIRQNLFYDDPATGDFGGQGIFMSDPGAGGYKNIVIEENLIAVNSTNTLVMNGGQEGVVIDSNVLMVRNPLGGSNLRLGDKAGYDNSGTTVTNNVYRNLADETRGSTVEGNFELGRGTDPSLFFQNHLGGGDWHDFLPVAGSPIDLSTGLGAADFLQGLIDGDASLGNSWEGAEDLAALWQELYGEPEPALDFSDVGTAQFVDTDADTMFDAGDASFSAETELGLVVTIDKSHPAAELIDAVQFVLDDGAYTHTERNAPLAMFGDTGAGKFNAGEFFTPGAHSVAINYLDADGNVLHTETVDFDIAAPDAPPVSYEIRVYNADTGELVCDLTDGSDIKLPDEDMNLAFTVVPVGEGAENVQSVRMILNGGEVERVESAAPYSLFGDAGMAQLFGQALRSGTFTLDIALYTEDGGQGEVIGGGETDFNLSSEPDLYEGLSSVDFVDTTSDQIIEVNPAEDALDGGTPLGLVVTIDAGHPAADQVAKVQFVLDNGAYEHTEAHVPYAMFGDSGPGAFNDGQLFAPGAHEVAINYLDAEGNTLFTETVTFNVAEPAAPVDPEPDTPIDPIPDNAIYVSNDAELKEALADATGGETIILKDGNYSAISSTRDFDDAITIKAENHLGASIESITLKNAQGFAVDGLDIPGGMSVRDNSSEISVSNSKIGTLLYFRDASYITVHNNDIAADGSGLILNSTHDFTVTHNNIHDAVEDLMRVTGNSYNGLVENNIVSDLLPSLNGNAHGEKTHSDLFQFLAGKDGTPHDITIRQNLFYDDPDTGDFGGQGIFISDPGAGGYRNILIEDNLISVASPNSITINGGQENVVVQNNTLMPSNGVGGAIIRLGDKAGMDNSGTSVKDNIVKVIGDETGHSEIDGNHVYGRDTDAFEFFEDAMEGGHWSDYLPGQGAPISVEDNVGANEFLKELAEGNTHLGTDWQDNLLSTAETVDDGLI